MDVKRAFEEGIKAEEFLKSVEDQDVINTIESRLDQFAVEPMPLEQELNILIIAEQWCIDCIVNLPILQQLLLNNNKVNHSIIDKEHYKQLFDIQDRVFIPLVIFYDEEFHAFGRWVETPYQMKEIRKIEDKKMIKEEMKDYKDGAYIQETINEIKAIVKPISK